MYGATRDWLAKWCAEITGCCCCSCWKPVPSRRYCSSSSSALKTVLGCDMYCSVGGTGACSCIYQETSANVLQRLVWVWLLLLTTWSVIFVSLLVFIYDSAVTDWRDWLSQNTSLRQRNCHLQLVLAHQCYFTEAKNDSVSHSLLYVPRPINIALIFALVWQFG